MSVTSRAPGLAEAAEGIGGPPPRSRKSWIETVTGQRFYPLDPRPEDIDIRDIAHALAHTSRYNGHCRHFYSVAQHSCLISSVCSRRLDKQWGLLHDAAEAYIGDLVRPIKNSGYFDVFKIVEKRILQAIAERFELPVPFPTALVRELDTAILGVEARDLMPSRGADWADVPFFPEDKSQFPHGSEERDILRSLRGKIKIEHWTPERARQTFLAQARLLGLATDEDLSWAPAAPKSPLEEEAVVFS